MNLIFQMIYFLMLWINGSVGIITVDQSPAVISAQPQDTVKILCRASQDIHDDMELYQFKPGQPPKHLIHDSHSRMSDTPDRFSGSYTADLTTFTITGVQLEDEAEYHCAHSSVGVITVAQSPAVISAQPQDTVKILCRASQEIGTDMELYQLKPGQAPKLMIYGSSFRHNLHAVSVPVCHTENGLDSVMIYHHTIDHTQTASQLTLIIFQDTVMIQIFQLICFLTWLNKGSSVVITVAQSPAVISAQPQGTVKILCRASQEIGNDMELYQLKPGQPPKLMVYDGNKRFSGTPSRFSGTWTGADHTFTIAGVQLEDEAEYHCGHSDQFPFTQ
ncbi:hypothetical protein ACEWY4_020368 [Coilia grayii]|uniref:Ig-like domain-containing protein n=1 Tax=Coilia grayii TaxID=363190 RepID=A0ABD1JE17_9TELE